MDALTAKMNRELLKYAVQRQIMCRFTGRVLDMCRDVLVQRYAGDKLVESLIMHATAWDANEQMLRDAVAARGERLEVIDGRKYYTPAGRARAASKIAA